MDSDLKIDWHSESSHVLLNPKLPQSQFEILKRAAQSMDLPGHIWIASSGSHSLKIIALSKIAFLNSARAVNKHLSVIASDLWLNPLPSFHVGGLSIFARAEISGSRVVTLQQWNPKDFVELCQEKLVTLSALVPTQIHDLIQANAQAPASLRGIVVGGAHLSEQLYLQGRKLGWPLLPSFGMTECCSQIATAEISSLSGDQYPCLKILEHCNLQTDERKILSVRTTSLMTGFFSFENETPRWNPVNANEWFQTEDHADISGDDVLPLGRGTDFTKINGESVSLKRLREKLDQLAPSVWRNQIAIDTEDSERSGHVLVLYCTPQVDAGSIKKMFDQNVAPYERLRQIKIVSEIPRNSMGKILYRELK